MNENGMNNYMINNSNNRGIKKVSPVTAIAIGMVLLIVVILTVSIVMINKRNYEEALKTVSMEYPSSIPEDYRLLIGTQLKNLLVGNYGVSQDTMIEAVVREDSYKEEIGEDLTNATFLVDIDEIKQTFVITATWSDTIVVPDGVLISCPTKAESKYPDSFCIGMYDNTDEVENKIKYPIYGDLPIVIDRFDFASRQALHCEVRGSFDEENKLVLKIVDFSGGMKEEALAKIRELGYNPDDYVIVYVDESGGF